MGSHTYKDMVLALIEENAVSNKPSDLAKSLGHDKNYFSPSQRIKRGEKAYKDVWGKIKKEIKCSDDFLYFLYDIILLFKELNTIPIIDDEDVFNTNPEQLYEARIIFLQSYIGNIDNRIDNGIYKYEAINFIHSLDFNKITSLYALYFYKFTESFDAKRKEGFIIEKFYELYPEFENEIKFFDSPSLLKDNKLYLFIPRMIKLIEYLNNLSYSYKHNLLTDSIAYKYNKDKIDSLKRLLPHKSICINSSLSDNTFYYIIHAEMGLCIQEFTKSPNHFNVYAVSTTDVEHIYQIFMQLDFNHYEGCKYRIEKMNKSICIAPIEDNKFHLPDELTIICEGNKNYTDYEKTISNIYEKLNANGIFLQEEMIEIKTQYDIYANDYKKEIKIPIINSSGKTTTYSIDSLKNKKIKNIKIDDDLEILYDGKEYALCWRQANLAIPLHEFEKHKNNYTYFNFVKDKNNIIIQLVNELDKVTNRTIYTISFNKYPVLQIVEEYDEAIIKRIGTQLTINWNKHGISIPLTDDDIILQL